MALVQSDNVTDSIVYTSRKFQPYPESFSDHYAFVGPSVFSRKKPDKEHERPLVYISLGTVINDRPDFYTKCIEAFKNENLDVIISCGKTVDIASLGKLPDNIRAEVYVDQLEILSRANAFVTHCGMNSVSESLYMATPMALYAQTNEQNAVARRVREIGAGKDLKDDSVTGIKNTVLEILQTPGYGKAAMECSEDFRNCSGSAGAADFIENAPHSSDGINVIKELNKANTKWQILYNAVVIALAIILFRNIAKKYLVVYIAAAIVLSKPVTNMLSKSSYQKNVAKLQNK